MFTPNDHFTEHLVDQINLIEPWRDCDAQIQTFCPCSLEPSGACSVKNRSRAKRSRSRSRRRTERGKGSDPDGPSPGVHTLTIARSRGACP
jgi:hypothetical protein